MHFNFLNYLLAFFEGLALILSPCILPILPIILSGTIAGGKKRPLGIIIGFVVIFALYTLFSHLLVTHLGVNLDRLRDVAFILIALFGVILVSEYLTAKFSALTQKLATISLNLTSKNTRAEGFFSGLILGALVSLTWTPCAGPILAAALIQIAVQKNLYSSFIALLAFALGSALPMLFIAFLGKKFMNNLNFIKKHTGLLRKIFGIIIIVSSLTMAYISHFRPDLIALLATAPGPRAIIADKTTTPTSTTTLVDELAPSYPAPSFAKINLWLNSPPLTLSQLQSKVVLIDFWTYSCINCIRTLPYLLAWNKAYRDQGLVIIGVHTPEFEFEKNPDNVRQAVIRFGIHYPIALDNQYATWNNYHNNYWPAHYLIDKQGQIVYQHFGEGDYKTTEHNIRILLGLNPLKNMTTGGVKALTPSENLTPETYLGYERAENFANINQAAINQTAYYTFPSQLLLNHWALQGSWRIKQQKIITMAANAELKIHFQAGHVYAVMGNNTNSSVKVKVLLNGKPIDSNAGADVKDGEITVMRQRLYEVAQFSKPTTGKITFIVDKAGLEIYTFTFG